MKKTHIFVLAGLAALATSSATVVATKTNIGGSSSSFGVNDNVSNTGEEINPTPSNDEGSKESNPANSNPSNVDKFTVTFDFNGGKYNGETTVTFNDVLPTTYFYYVKERLSGGTIVNPDPSDYHTFVGYSLSPNDSTNLINDTYVIKENNIIFYAQYSINEHTQSTVVWKDDGQFHGGTPTSISSEKYFIGQTPLFKDQYPIHDGFVFDHWDPEIVAIPAADNTYTYTAVYTNSKAYTVTLDYNNPDESLHTQKVADGGLAVEPKVTYLGHSIKQWNYLEGGTGTFTFNTSITGNIKIQAEWQPDTCNITYVANGGTITTSTSIAPYGGTIENAPTLANRDGYDKTQVTWWTTDTFDTDTQFTFGAEGTGTQVTGDLTLFAKWPAIKQYTVSFWDDSADPVEYVTLKQIVNHGEKVQRPENPTKTGYTFVKWHDANTTDPYDFDTPITGEFGLYATFSVNTYRVTLSLNGGTLSSGSNYYDVNYNSTIPTAPVVTAPEDMAQPTWYTSPDFAAASEFKFGDADHGTKVTDNITIYAKYQTKAGESFANDSWNVFLNEINNKSFASIKTSEAYADDYASTDGKDANTFVGLKRNLTITNDKGVPTTYQAVVVDENPDAQYYENKFTFMFTSAVDKCAFDDSQNYYPNSYLSHVVDKLSYGIQNEIKKGTISNSLSCWNPIPPSKNDVIHDVNFYTPSVYEIFGDSGIDDDTPRETPPNTDTQFSLFKKDSSKTATYLKDTWLRTPTKSQEGLAYFVNNSGAKTMGSISEEHNVCVAFDFGHFNTINSLQ
ncbi:MAG: InlB B-repeat-containing protein [Bacilli bacterium]|nr:InlB B-repeat-containing protein [Bacilli bacterium]